MTKRRWPMPPAKKVWFSDGSAMKFKVKRSHVSPSDGADLDTTVLRINRCATVVKGGRRFSFSALVVVGDRRGVVGYGFGKANEVPPAVEKAEIDARKHLYRIAMKGDTIPREIWGRFGASKVLLMPASPGTGVIAGAAVRGVVELAGIKNILTKSYGSTNPINLVKATVQGLLELRTLEEVEALRGVSLSESTPARGEKEEAAEAGAGPAAPAGQGSA